MTVADSKIEQAVEARANEFRKRRESLTLKQVRRILEEDLEVPETALDDKKIYIKGLIEKVMEEDEEEEAGGEHEDEEEEEEEETKKRKPAKKRAKKAPAKKKESTRKKRRKGDDEDDEEDDDDEDDEDEEEAEAEDSEEDVRRRKKAEKKAPAPRAPKTVYGKRVEKLKDIIKQCGIVIPPNIYKKANQASEREREDLLVKELEGILDREGLSSDPSEKDIKDCKRRKQKQKDLEGIELDNILDEPRGRRAARSVPTYKYEPDEDEDEEDGDEDEDDGDDNDEEPEDEDSD